jgi:hypothetical protein
MEDSMANELCKVCGASEHVAHNAKLHFEYGLRETLSAESRNDDDPSPQSLRRERFALAVMVGLAASPREPEVLPTPASIQKRAAIQALKWADALILELDAK